MGYQNLQEFIALLEKKNLLKRVKAEVDQDLEISEIVDRVTREGGPALLFEKIKGQHLPVAVNLFGTLERMHLALECDSLDSIGDRIRELLKMQAPTGFMDKVMMLPKLAELSGIIPKTVSRGACQEVVEKNDPRFSSLPILKCWPKDGGRYITFSTVITMDPETSQRNMGLYRMQVYDDKTAGMHWHIHKDGARHQDKYRALKTGKMPVAVVIGADPATMYAASAPLPYGLDELLFAGFLRKKSVETVKCITVDLEVPAEAEIVLEGYVDPQEKRPEGPFGDHTGYYSEVDEYPVFHLTCISRQKNAVYPATLVGRPWQEDYYYGLATARIFLPIIQAVLPEIKDLHFPREGVFHNCVIVSIRKSYPGQAKKVIHGLWGLGLLMLCKLIVVVDEDVDIKDIGQVAWRALGSIDARRDVIISEGPVDDLDHASSLKRLGGKMGVDATIKGASEGMTRIWPDEVSMPEDIQNLVTKRWKEYGL